jgi:pyruvate ferredoxin oxidoreductase alpha subunit
VNLDGFILTHAIERMTPVETQDVKAFVGEYKPLYPLLDYKNPVSHGLMDAPDFYYQHKYQMVEAMKKAYDVAVKAFKDFEKITGRKYQPVTEYMCDDAEYIAIVIGSTFGTMKAAVDELRAEGHKVGCAMPRLFRPFPEADFMKVMKGKKAVAVMDKHLSVGAYGPLFPEIAAAAISLESIPGMYNYIYGLGGVDVTVNQLKQVFVEMETGKSQKINFLGVKI